MKRQMGFSLMELMIVLAVIVIILAMALPGMKEAKIHADEASAIQSIRAINQAEVQYLATYGGYADSLAKLGGADPCHKSPDTACLLDDSLAGGTKEGYSFTAIGENKSGGDNTSYAVGAAPEVFDRTGRRRFCSSEKNVIRGDPNGVGNTTPPDEEQCAKFSAIK